MMRFHQAATAGLAALFVLPAATQLGFGDGLDLEARLAATTRALESLVGLESRLVSGEDDAVVEVLNATEAPILDEEGRDKTLNSLRRDVSALNETLDQLSMSEEEGAAVRAVVGLTEGERSSLRTIQSGNGVITTDTVGKAEEGDQAEATKAFERDPAYTADALRQARLMIRADRSLEAISILEQLLRGEGANAEVRYWLARAYDNAELFNEALTAYDALADDATAGKYQERAELDRGFLRLKIELLESEKKQGDRQ